jgi:hypothetical protein
MGRYSDNLICSISLQILPQIAEANYHYLFDQDMWLLMPEDGIVDKYYKSLNDFGAFSFIDRECFPVFPVCFLSYQTYHNLVPKLGNIRSEAYFTIDLCL